MFQKLKKIIRADFSSRTSSSKGTIDRHTKENLFESEGFYLRKK